MTASCALAVLSMDSFQRKSFPAANVLKCVSVCSFKNCYLFSPDYIAPSWSMFLS